jgi:hypothetical protein
MTKLVDAVDLPVCDVCLTSSYRTCSETDKGAVPNVADGGFMLCECCSLHDLVEYYQRTQHEYSTVSAAWFDVLVQIVNMTGEPRDAFIALVKNDLQSHTPNLDRFLCLEWHLWAEERPEENTTLILEHTDGYLEVFMAYFLPSEEAQFKRWAYLPDTGWLTAEE